MSIYSTSPRRPRGRPRKVPKLVLPFSHSLDEWSARTGESVPTLWRRMRAGKVRYVQTTPGAPRRIPCSEYLRLGYFESLEQLVEFLSFEPKPDQTEAATTTAAATNTTAI